MRLRQIERTTEVTTYLSDIDAKVCLSIKEGAIATVILENDECAALIASLRQLLQKASGHEH